MQTEILQKLVCIISPVPIGELNLSNLIKNHENSCVVLVKNHEQSRKWIKNNAKLCVVLVKNHEKLTQHGTRIEPKIDE